MDEVVAEELGLALGVTCEGVVEPLLAVVLGLVLGLVLEVVLGVVMLGQHGHSCQKVLQIVPSIGFVNGPLTCE